jgi:hypothetical protein
MKLPVLGMALVFLFGPAVAVADDLEDAVQNLKEAAAKKDVDGIKKLAATIRPMATAILKEAAPASADEKKAYDERIAYAKTTIGYVDSVFYTVALQSPAAVQVDLFSALEQDSPKSKWLGEGYGNYLVALKSAGAAAKIPGVAEKGLANFPDNEDLLLYLCDRAMSANQADRALTYANRLTAALNKKAKPDNLSAADWDRKRTAALGHGYYVAGVVSATKQQWVPADKNLRAALPLIQGQAGMQGPALFYLGMANYNLGKMTNNKAKLLDAVKFSEQSMVIDSPFSEQARHNALVMKDEAARMR